MRKVLLAALSGFLLTMCAAGKDKPPKEYPLSAHVRSTYLVQVSARATTGVQTNCTTNDASANCNSHLDTKGGESRYVSEIDLSDGNRYVVTCRVGFWAGFGAGASQGGGNDVVTGCKLLPGDYRARWDKHVLILEILNDKKQAKEVKFDVIEVREQPKKDPQK